MNIVCLDMEGVLVPEVWFELAEASGIPELRITTREEPDYDKLMRNRVRILKENGIGIDKLIQLASTIDPLPGATEFLDELRGIVPTIILSDTFFPYIQPVLAKLHNPTIFCNELVVAEDGEILDYRMRCEKSKLTTVRGLQSIGFETIAAGDSFNDLAMIQASKAGFLFRTTEQIKKDYPQYPAFDDYDEFLAAIKSVL